VKGEGNATHWRAALFLKLLGAPQLKNLDVRVHLGTNKALAILAYLAIKKHPVRRSELDALLWPEHDDNRARRSLRDELSRINQALNYKVVVSDHQEVSLTEQGLDVDVWQLERALAADRLAEAVALYTGNLLEGFHVRDAAPFESWLEDERAELIERILKACERLFEAAFESGNYAEALQYARRMIEIDRLAEESYILAMRSAALFGDRVGALRIYRDLVSTLFEELQIEPGDEARILAEQIEVGLERVALQRDASMALPPESAGPTPLEPGVHRIQQSPIKHNLPPTVTSFIGRTKELDTINTQLRQSGCRLLTLVGMGGIGKTRLARETAAQLLTSYRDGVWFVPMVAASTLDFLFFAIAKAIELPLDDSSPVKEQLLAFLAGKEILLILDGLEHLTIDVEPIQALLTAAPNILILATSRKRLNLAGEYVFDVKGMPFPEEDEALSDTLYEAVDLFVERAHRVNPGIVFTPEDELHIQSICRLMGGVPLAIELAAALVRTFSCKEIVDEIEENFDVIDSDLRDIPIRHRALRIVLEQSWTNLSPEQQRVFGALSLLRGRFSKDEAREIAGADFKTLASLVECSLVRRHASGSYQLLEVMRRYAREKLDFMQETKQEVVAAHQEYYGLTQDDV
jgi:predicted ATPase/DNA-binding SARP family transcriptional activator